MLQPPQADTSSFRAQATELRVIWMGEPTPTPVLAARIAGTPVHFFWEQKASLQNAGILVYSTERMQDQPPTPPMIVRIGSQVKRLEGAVRSARLMAIYLQMIDQVESGEIPRGEERQLAAGPIEVRS